MTTHYIDIHILPDPEFSEVHLLAALYAKLHRALVELAANDIGVSFPQYSLQPRGLGRLLRLHGSDAALQRLRRSDWLRGMRDHTDVSPLSPVPLNVEYRQLRRRQFKTNVERLRRRRMRRKSESWEQVLIAIPEFMERRPDLPYLRMRSSSTGQPFCLFLELSAAISQKKEGAFNSYGLSTIATVPWF